MRASAELTATGTLEPTTDYAKPVNQVVSIPGEPDLKRLTQQRSYVESLATSCPGNSPDFSTASGKLQAIQAILDAKLLKTTQTNELQCLGIVLGDAFVVQHGLEWVMVEDQIGRDPALRYPGSTLLVFPMTMISKRVERGEAFDVAKLFTGIADGIDKTNRGR